jgi:imidazoleglycerol phosphate dehydratase HisB
VNPSTTPPPRRAEYERRTRETEIVAALDLEPVDPRIRIDTGIGMLDHMLASLATHAGWSLQLDARGDLHVDDHHVAEQRLNGDIRCGF